MSENRTFQNLTLAIEETVQKISDCGAVARISQALLDLKANLEKSVLDLTGSLRFVVTMTLIEASESIVNRAAFDSFIKFLQECAFPILNDKASFECDSLTIPRRQYESMGSWLLKQ